MNDRMEIRVIVDKGTVYEAVSMETSYIGAKAGNGESYERTFTTEADGEMLDLLWREACTGAADQLRAYVRVLDCSGECFHAELSVSSNFNTALAVKVEAGLEAYLRGYMVGKWMLFLNREESALRLQESASAMQEVRRMLCHKGKPARIANIDE